MRFKSGLLMKCGRFDLLINPMLLPTDKNQDYYTCLFDDKALISCANTQVIKGRGITLLFEKYKLKLVLREYLRGGFISKFNKKSYIAFSYNSYRSFLEFELLNNLYAQGLHVPLPVVAMVSYHFPMIQNKIVLQQIENSDNLDTILQKRNLNAIEVEAIQEQLHRLFELKVVHTDLNIKNILLDKDNKSFIIDFDKCYIKNNFNIADKKHILERLERSFIKQKHIHEQAHRQCFIDDELITKLKQV